MALTAPEWILLPKKEQERRKGELSPHECFLLRTIYFCTYFTEEEKANMTGEQKQAFIHRPILTEEEKEARIKSIDEVFRKMIESASKKRKT